MLCSRLEHDEWTCPKPLKVLARSSRSHINPIAHFAVIFLPSCIYLSWNHDLVLNLRALLCRGSSMTTCSFDIMLSGSHIYTSAWPLKNEDMKNESELGKNDVHLRADKDIFSRLSAWLTCWTLSEFPPLPLTTLDAVTRSRCRGRAC